MVDDDHYVLQALAEILTDVLPGVEIFKAPDGGRAMVEMKRHRPHLVITDLQMPVLSGQDFVGMTGAVGPFAGFILISGGDETVLRKAKEDHALVDAVLPKPVDVAELLREVFRLLEMEDQTTSGAPEASSGSREAAAEGASGASASVAA